MKILNEMKREHEDYMFSSQISQDIEAGENLFSYVEREIKKPERGSGYGLLLPDELEEYEVRTEVKGQ